MPKRAASHVALTGSECALSYRLAPTLRTAGERVLLRATDENQGWLVALLTEFAVISGEGWVAEVSLRGVDRLLRGRFGPRVPDSCGCWRILRARGQRRA